MLCSYGINHLVRRVHLLHAAHEDLQVDPDQREQGAGEVHLALHVYRHGMELPADVVAHSIKATARADALLSLRSATAVRICDLTLSGSSPTGFADGRLKCAPK